jgi:hypothetical protein
VAEGLSKSFPGTTAYFWPPGLPFLLSGIFRVLGPGAAQARLLTVGAGVAGVALVVVLAEQVAREHRTVLAAGWLAALYPPSLLLAAQPYTEELALVCLVGTTVAVLKSWETRRAAWFAVAGAALGFGILVRPSLLSVAAALAVIGVIAWRRDRAANGKTRQLLVGAAAMAAVVAVILVPVAAFNANHGGGLNVSTNNERNLFLGNNRYTPLYKASHLAQRLPEELPPEVRAYLADFENRPDSRAAMRSEALRYMSSHPLETIVRTTNRIRSFWGFDYVLSREIQQAYGGGGLTLLVPLSLEAGGYVLVATLILVGLITARRRIRRPAVWLLPVLAGAFMVPYAIAFSVPVYHHPAVGLLLPFAAAGLWELNERRSGMLRDKWVVAGVALFAAVQIEFAWFAARFS